MKVHIFGLKDLHQAFFCPSPNEAIFELGDSFKGVSLESKDFIKWLDGINFYIKKFSSIYPKFYKDNDTLEYDTFEHLVKKFIYFLRGVYGKNT